MNQRRSIIKEIQPTYFLYTKKGCETMNNQRDMKIELHRFTIFENSMEQQFYSTVTYLKEANGWIKTNNSSRFSSIDEFMSRLRDKEDFTSAYRDYQLTKE